MFDRNQGKHPTIFANGVGEELHQGAGDIQVTTEVEALIKNDARRFVFGNGLPDLRLKSFDIFLPGEVDIGAILYV
jgi:hypothetical protein